MVMALLILNLYMKMYQILLSTVKVVEHLICQNGKILVGTLLHTLGKMVQYIPMKLLVWVKIFIFRNLIVI